MVKYLDLGRCASGNSRDEQSPWQPCIELSGPKRAFEDPAALQGTEEERLAIFRRVRNEIRDYLKTFPENVR
ncbi:MAG TPA: hypothetical protein VNY04_10375 [Chthoniobacterales bacterium]|nr:hypothetical protein [Chthoniobacterales bacterium]